MINIDVFYNDQDRVVGFDIRGHAMGPERADEFDLVCCGVSVLSITTVNGITDYLRIAPKELSVADGLLRFVLPTEKDGTPAITEPVKAEQVEALLGSMLLGLQEMAGDHPNYIRLNKRRWTSC